MLFSEYISELSAMCYIYIYIYIYLYIYIYIFIFILIYGHLILQAIKDISLFGETAQWLERVHGKHEAVGSNPTRDNYLYGIENSQLKMNTIYIYIYIQYTQYTFFDLKQVNKVQ